ncbi:hypothetical protein Trydic_g20193 [Trypoxylus dichotomus]
MDTKVRGNRFYNGQTSDRAIKDVKNHVKCEERTPIGLQDPSFRSQKSKCLPKSSIHRILRKDSLQVAINPRTTAN